MLLIKYKGVRDIVEMMTLTPSQAPIMKPLEELFVYV